MKIYAMEPNVLDKKVLKDTQNETPKPKGKRKAVKMDQENEEPLSSKTTKKDFLGEKSPSKEPRSKKKKEIETLVAEPLSSKTTKKDFLGEKSPVTKKPRKNAVPKQKEPETEVVLAKNEKDEKKQQALERRREKAAQRKLEQQAKEEQLAAEIAAKEKELVAKKEAQKEKRRLAREAKKATSTASSVKEDEPMAKEYKQHVSAVKKAEKEVAEPEHKNEVAKEVVREATQKWQDDGYRNQIKNELLEHKHRMHSMIFPNRPLPAY